MIELHSIKDPRGTLSVAERELPFQPSRVFFVHEINAIRGGHRHRINRMILFAVAGRIRIQVQSPNQDAEYVLENPKLGLLLEPEDWHEFEALDPQAVLVVLCSHPYDPDDYIQERYR